MLSMPSVSFGSCQLPHVLSLGTTEKSMAPTCLLTAACSQVFTNMNNAPWEFSSPGYPQAGTGTPVLSHLCGPLLDSLHYIHITLVLKKHAPQEDMSDSSSASYPPGPTGPFLRRCSPASQLSVWSSAFSYSACMARTLHFSLLNFLFTEIFSNNFTSLFRTLWMAGQPWSISHSSQFCIVCRHAKGILSIVQVILYSV